MGEVIEISVSDTAVKSAFDKLVAEGFMHGWMKNDQATADRFNQINMALIMMIMSSHYTLDKQSQLSNQLISDINNTLGELNAVVAGKALASDVSTSINLINQQFIDLRSKLDQITALAQGNASGIAKMLGEMATDDEVLTALNSAIGNHYTKNEIIELLKQYQLISVGATKDDLAFKADKKATTDALAFKASLDTNGKIPTDQLPVATAESYGVVKL